MVSRSMKQRPEPDQKEEDLAELCRHCARQGGCPLSGAASIPLFSRRAELVQGRHARQPHAAEATVNRLYGPC